ncbi:MAG: BON domain-containing protein [Bryobacteraceae bacterium]|jgi:osmotically-inducible protein OsmY
MILKRILVPAVLFLTVFTTVLAAAKPVSDDFLVDTIRQKLAADPVVKGGAIEVIAKDGTITLRGTVEEDKQKNKAEKIAKKVSGVKGVVNEIKLARPPI